MILRRMQESAATGASASIDLTPIIDMVFLLLIFFLAATTFQRDEREMQIALPETKAAGPISGLLQEFVINVRSDGTAVVAGASLDDVALERAVRDAIAQRVDRKVVVRGDRAAAYAAIARVLDICKRSGANEPYLETTPTR